MLFLEKKSTPNSPYKFAPLNPYTSFLVKFKNVGAPMAAFNSQFDIICRSLPTKKNSERMSSSLYVIREEEELVKRELKRSKSTSDLSSLMVSLNNKNEKLCRDLIYLKQVYINGRELVTPSSIGNSTFENSNRKLSPATASIYFSYNPLGCQFNTIEKCLIKRKSSSTASNKDQYSEIHLLSIELDSPTHVKVVANKLQETPLLITKLNKNQMRQTKEIRKLIPCDCESPKTTSKSSLINTPSKSSLSSENQRNVLNTIEHERPESSDRPPNCIQTLVEMIKLIRAKFWPVKKNQISTPSMEIMPIPSRPRDQILFA